MSNAADFLLVRLGLRRVGIPILAVIAVESVGEIFPVPTSDVSCRGVTMMRGRLMPLVRLGGLIDNTSPETGGTAVVLQIGGRHLCLEVDEAEAIVRGELLPLPPGESLPWAAGVVRRAEGLVLLLDLEALSGRLSAPEVLL
ncbi:MAG: chemotaxis protein CheW [Gemmatimonadota bacterium]